MTDFNVDISEKFPKEKNVCLAGHRPEKLPDDGNIAQLEMREVYRHLLQEIDKAAQNGKLNFMHGMMSGFDVIAAEAVLKMKRKHPHIHLLSVLPFMEDFMMSKEWHDKWGQRAVNVYKKSDCRICLTDKYYTGAYHDRAKWMIAQSSLLICYRSAASGGTAYTVSYAVKNHIPVVNLAALQQKSPDQPLLS